MLTQEEYPKFIQAMTCVMDLWVLSQQILECEIPGLIFKDKIDPEILLSYSIKMGKLHSTVYSNTPTAEVFMYNPHNAWGMFKEEVSSFEPEEAKEKLDELKNLLAVLVNKAAKEIEDVFAEMQAENDTLRWVLNRFNLNVEDFGKHLYNVIQSIEFE